MRHDTDVQDHQTSTAQGSPLVHLEGSGYKVADGDPDVRGWEVIGSDGRRIGEVDDLLVDTAAMKVRYLEVRLDRHLAEDAQGAEVARAEEIAAAEERPPSLPEQGLPQLDSMAGFGSTGGVIGHVAVPGVLPGLTLPMDIVTESFQEDVVRATLSDTENQLTADRHLGGRSGLGDRHILIPIGRARLDTDEDRILVDSLRAEDARGLPEYERGALTRDDEDRLRRAFGGTTAGADDFYGHDDLYDESRFYHPRRSRRSA